MVLTQVFLLTTLLAHVNTSPSSQLSNACNQIFNYNSVTPIHFKNDIDSWSSNSLSQKSCQFMINTTLPGPDYFMIRINVNPNDKSTSRINIIDHDGNHKLNTTLLNETGINEQFKIINFIHVKSSCFEINLFPGKNEDSYKNIRSITITRGSKTDQNNCKENEFKCSNFCIDQSLLCDEIASCSDSSDEENCTHLITPTPAATLDQTNILENTNSSLESNATMITIEQKSGNVKYIIGLLIAIIILAAVVLGAWSYGKRKQKWREFIAQLDNNTDWEYEQLDDNHHPMASRSNLPTMTPMFNIKITDDANERAERVPIN